MLGERREGGLADPEVFIWQNVRMYLGTSHSCMFQPQDQIEVGEDGLKQYDGKTGSFWKGWGGESVCGCVTHYYLIQSSCSLT